MRWRTGRDSPECYTRGWVGGICGSQLSWNLLFCTYSLSLPCPDHSSCQIDQPSPFWPTWASPAIMESERDNVAFFCCPSSCLIIFIFHLLPALYWVNHCSMYFPIRSFNNCPHVQSHLSLSLVPVTSPIQHWALGWRTVSHISTCLNCLYTASPQYTYVRNWVNHMIAHLHHHCTVIQKTFVLHHVIIIIHRTIVSIGNYLKELGQMRKVAAFCKMSTCNNFPSESISWEW